MQVGEAAAEQPFAAQFPPEELQVAPLRTASSLPQYQGVMADYMARMEAAKRKAEALEMQRLQMQEQQEVEASGPSATIVAGAAELNEAGPSTQNPAASPGPQGLLGDYMSRLDAARAMQERQVPGQGKQAQATILDLDLGDINRTGSGPIEIQLKPKVTRGQNTQLAHLARVAAELKDLAGHVGQRAEGKQVAKPDPRKSGIGSLQQFRAAASSAAVQSSSQPLSSEDFSSDAAAS